MILNESGIAGLLHPENTYEDPDGYEFREAIYARLQSHYQFQNEKKLFPIHNTNKYSINIYKSKPAVPSFINISNIFHPSCIDGTLEKDSFSSVVPGLKNRNGEWDTSGHKDRAINVGIDELKLFSNLYDPVGTPATQARLPAVHAKQVLSVLDKISKHPSKLSTIENSWSSSGMFNETYAREDGTLNRNTGFPSCLSEFVYGGPHFQIANPFFQTPRKVCETNRSYDLIDIGCIGPEYQSRTNYVPGNKVDFERKIPRVKFGDTRRITSFYRFLNREMVGSSSERTFISTIIPPGTSHLKSCVSVAFEEEQYLLDFCSFSFSLVSDYFVKNTGLSHVNISLLRQLPMISQNEPGRRQMWVRTLILCCLTAAYKDLWERCWLDEYNNDSVTNRHEIIQDSFNSLSSEWCFSNAARTDLYRRQLLVELDVLSAINIGMSLEELLTIYRIQFPTMHQYENDTWYDAKGRVVFTPSTSLGIKGLKRKANKKADLAKIEYPDGTTETKPLGWEDICPAPAPTENGRRINYANGQSYGKSKIPDGTKIHRAVTDDTLPGGPREKTITYIAPFYLPDREEDYRIAWEVFTERFAKENEQGQTQESEGSAA